MVDKDNDVFKPKIGRIRSRGGARAKTYLNRVLDKMSAAGSGGFGKSVGRARFTGVRIGRGNDVLRLRRAGHRFGQSYRRVVIKTRIVKLKGGGIDAVRAHLRYIQRDGVSKEHEPGQLYDATHDEADGKALLERSKKDRHQFRFFVSPEEATELSDLRPFVRDLMVGMEEDLGTKLDWVAVDHFNTEHPHSHIVLRGKDEFGKDLVIARDYIAYGMRRRASEILTLELGPQTEVELRRKLERQVDQDRFTDLDRAMVRDAVESMVDTRSEHKHPDDRFKLAMRVGRLRVLASRGLAEETAPGRWRLSPQIEDTLSRAGERGDIIKTMHRGLRQVGLDAGASEFSIYDPADPRAPAVTGRIIDRGLHDELNDGHYIQIDAADGRVHYVALDPRQDMEDLPLGAIIEVYPASVGPKPSDRVIAEVARENDDLYSPDAHRIFDPRASTEFVEAHVRRLEALRRSNVVRRFPDGSWEVPGDFENKVEALAKNQTRYPDRIAVLSSFPLESQIRADGATWLDRQLLAKEPTALRGGRLAAETADALGRRQEYLIGQRLAERRGGQIRYQRNLLRVLRQRELSAVGQRLAKEMGLAFTEARNGERIEGIYRRSVHLASGKFAIIEKSKEFTLVPWRPVLERQRGKIVGGIMRGSSVSFDFTKKRGIGIG